MIVIPKTFSLGGRTWEVKVVDEPGTGEMGNCAAHEARILLRKGMTEEETHHTFYHELTHALCYTLGWTKLNKNEAKIDALGGLLYQFINTRKGNCTK